MSDIDDAQAEVFSALFKIQTDEVDFLVKLMDVFAYQGFDPIHTYMLLKKKGGSDARKFAEEVKEIIVFYIVRGTKFTKDKVINRTSAAGKERIRALCNKYGLVDRVPTSKDDINIGRLIAVFPHVTARIMFVFADKVRIVGEVPQGLAKCLCFPAGASIIPREGYTSTYEAWREWNANFTAMITTTPSTQKKADYGSIIHNSSYVSEENRVKLMESLKVPQD